MGFRYTAQQSAPTTRQSDPDGPCSPRMRRGQSGYQSASPGSGRRAQCACPGWYTAFVLRTIYSIEGPDKQCLKEEG